MTMLFQSMSSCVNGINCRCNTSSVFSPTADSRTTLGGASEDRSHFGDTTFESTFDNKAQLDESLDSTMGSLPEDTLSKNETVFVPG